MSQVDAAYTDEGGVLARLTRVRFRAQRRLSRPEKIMGLAVLVAWSVYGRRKPDPWIFLYATQQIGSLPERCTHVGDKISRDILGARRAGFGLAVRIEHAAVDGPEPHQPFPDLTVSDLRELLGTFESPSGPRDAAAPRDSIKAVFFDAEDILYHRPRRGRHLAELLESFAHVSTPASEEEQKAVKNKAMVGEMSKRDYMLFSLRSLGVLDESRFEQAIVALQNDANDVAFFDHARETLLELKRRGYRLGIITDTSIPRPRSSAGTSESASIKSGTSSSRPAREGAGSRIRRSISPRLIGSASVQERRPLSGTRRPSWTAPPRSG